MAAQNSARPAGNGGPAASIPTESLRLWLRADAGVHTNGARVTRWTDQSGSGNDAKQSLSANQPVSVLNAINGKPVVRFDGISDFMSFNLPVNGSTAMTVVLVSATTQDVASNNEGSPAPLYWDQTAGWGMLYVNPLQRSLQWRFGTGQYLNLPTYTRPASIGNNYSQTTVVKNGTTETAYVNGSLVLTQTGKLAAIANVTDAAYLGHNLYANTYFPGDLAEVLVYTRALSDTERQQVGQYLMGKYFSSTPVNQAPIVSAGPNQTITLPAIATLSGTATDDGLPNGTLTTTWSKVSGPGTVTFGNASALSTTAAFSAAGTYVFRLTASDGALTSTSDVTIIANNAITENIPVQGLKLWLRADAGVTLNASGVSRWADQSGNGTDAKQATGANQPTLISGAVNGQPVVRFDGVAGYMNFTLPVNGLTAMTLVLVSATTQDVASNNEGSPAPLYWDQTAAWGMLYVNPLQRSLQWRFGTGQYLNLPTYTRPASIGNNYSLTTVVKNGTMETAYVNGSLVLTQTGKLTTIANVTDAAYLGHDLYSNTYFPGDLAEVLVYTRALSDTERQQVEQYLFAKYLLGWAPQPVNQAPIVSAGPNQTITLPASATLSGTATDDGLPNGILTTTWSKVSGPGTVTFGNASALSTTASFSAAGTYVLRLTASDSALSSSSDVTITVNSSSSGGSSTPPPGAVVINPGDNIQSLVNSHPAGSVYYLNAGVYRLQTITPHSGDTFIGTLDASGNRLSILNGAKIIPSSNFVPSGSQWVAAGETQVIPPDPNTAASCMGDSPRCLYAEELFLDGVRLHQVASISAVVPRTWFYDSAAAKAYIGQDPTGHTIERSITARAFNSVANVTVKNLVVEKYANYSTSGAISSVAIAGWNIQNNEIRNNHGAGAFVGPGSKLLNNFVHHNGQIGFLGNGASVTNSPILEEGNEISFNNDAGYRYDWEAGGTKFLRTYYLVVRNNYSHDNRGLGLWTDYGNYYTTYESNRSARDKEVGISHELSFDATVRYNVVENMLQSEFYQNSMWNNCGIGNVHSRRVTVYGNAVLNNVNGICGLMDARPNNSEYPEGFAVSDFNVHDNAVVQLMNFAGGITVASGATTNPYDPSQNNRWTNNIYKLDSNTAPRYLWGGCGACTTNQWKPIPQDAIGTWINPADATFASITFNAGDRLQATATTQVRSLPSATDGILVGTQSVGATGTVTIVRGPIYTGGAWWWQVHYDNGITGWSPGGTLQKSP